MSRKRKYIQKEEKPDLTKSLADLSLEEISALNKAIPNLLNAKLQQMMASDEVEDIMKANLYIDASTKKDVKLNSVFFDPNDVSDSGREYKRSKGVLSFETLRRMGDIFVVRSVVNTRVEQVQNFLHFSIDDQREGYTIRKKRSIIDRGSIAEELKEEDQKKIEYIVNFLENGGINDKWANFDTFQDFGRKIVFDSLTLDQLAFEIVRDRGWNLSKFRAVDASLIRLLNSVDPKQRDEFEKYRFRGYLPRYCMVWENQVLRNPSSKESVVYYPWELGFGIRNKSTSIHRNGYGTSELETLVEIISGILYGIQYNTNFFTKGSMPKGFINIKDTNMDNATLNEFRQMWTQTMVGVRNSHRVPVLQGLNMEWVDLQKLSNRDMEFNEWIKFLIIITCSVYRIDPSELGFQFKDQAQIFGQDGQKQRLQHSRDKGLKPLLIFIQNIINHYLVSEIDENYEFVFTGVENANEEGQVELDKKKLEAGMVSMEDIFRKYSRRNFDKEKDTILNPVYQTARATDQNQQMYAEPQVGEVDMNGENPFDAYKSLSDNPIFEEGMKYFKNNWGKK